VIPSKIKSFIHTWSLAKNTNVCITSNTIEYDQSKQNKKLSKIIREITSIERKMIINVWFYKIYF
jgi:hypothetical protein